MSTSNRKAFPRGSAGVVCLLLCLCLTLGTRAAEDPLWTAYTEGTAARAQELTACADHLAALRATAAKKGPAANWAIDPDVRFLLQHRTPAALTIGRELAKDQPDPYLAALVWTAARLGHRELMGELPGTLARARTDAGRLCILDALACLDTPQALKSLDEFLAAATAKTPEALICAACEGLGHTGQPAQLPRLLAAEKLVHSPLGLIQVAAARLQCGDPTAQKQLLAALGDAKSEPEVRAFVLGFLVDHPIEQISPMLADLAVDAKDPQRARLALRALTAATGYDRPCDPAPMEPLDPQEADKAGTAEQAQAPETLRLESFPDMTREDRTKLVKEILDWWHEHPPAVREAAARRTELLPN